jgi:hypothetical protein
MAPDCIGPIPDSTKIAPPVVDDAPDRRLEAAPAPDALVPTKTSMFPALASEDFPEDSKTSPDDPYIAEPLPSNTDPLTDPLLAEVRATLPLAPSELPPLTSVIAPPCEGLTPAAMTTLPASFDAPLAPAKIRTLPDPPVEAPLDITKAPLDPLLAEPLVTDTPPLDRDEATPVDNMNAPLDEPAPVIIPMLPPLPCVARPAAILT